MSKSFEIESISNKVLVWTRKHRPDDIHFASPRTYYLAALMADVISQDEFDFADKHFGDLFYYTGD
jgi:hypothetical protein